MVRNLDWGGLKSNWESLKSSFKEKEKELAN